MIQLTVNRIFSNENKTLSECFITELKNGHPEKLAEFKGIELPWKQNQRRISCIPAEKYKAIAVRRSSNGSYALWVQDVPNRSEIMVHSANFARQLLGCLAPGKEFMDIDIDGVIDVTNSRAVMKEIEKIIPLGTEIEFVVVDLWRIENKKPVL